MITFILDRNITISGCLADETGSPTSAAPLKGQFSVSAFDSTIGQYGAYIYFSDGTPTPDVTISAIGMSAYFAVLQPPIIKT